MEALASVAVVLLAAGAVYEAAVALELLSIGPLPGEGPAGGSVVGTAALLGFLLAIGTSLVNARRSDARSGISLTLLAPAAAAFMVARFYAFDPYYAPSLRRASEGGLVSAWWVFALVGASVSAAILVTIRPRLGSAVTCLVAFLCAVTALFEGLGH